MSVPHELVEHPTAVRLWRLYSTAADMVTTDPSDTVADVAAQYASGLYFGWFGDQLPWEIFVGFMETRDLRKQAEAS